ncbi:MAG: hypothetical protein ACXWP0_01260 [Ktedonobacterales bacterium]
MRHIATIETESYGDLIVTQTVLRKLDTNPFPEGIYGGNVYWECAYTLTDAQGERTIRLVHPMAQGWQSGPDGAQNMLSMTAHDAQEPSCGYTPEQWYKETGLAHEYEVCGDGLSLENVKTLFSVWSGYAEALKYLFGAAYYEALEYLDG